VARRSPLLPLGNRSVCPVANVLDILGDRWTLLVVRDLLLFRKVRYGELADSLERIPTNLLADRLRRLEKAGVVRRVAYQSRPTRYEYRLTDRGTDLMPILREMAIWAKRHVRGVGARPPDAVGSQERGRERAAGRAGVPAKRPTEP
jgi:DNA-binding HxlR family transcriptional regulator